MCRENMCFKCPILMYQQRAPLSHMNVTPSSGLGNGVLPFSFFGAHNECIFSFVCVCVLQSTP